MKGFIKRIKILDRETPDERIQFDVEIPNAIHENDIKFIDLQILECSEDENKSVVRFYVYKLKRADGYQDDRSSYTIVPFQISYAVSIHKAQVLEYGSVKIIITDEENN